MGVAERAVGEWRARSGVRAARPHAFEAVGVRAAFLWGTGLRDSPASACRLRLWSWVVESVIPERYWRLSMLWSVFGAMATILPLANLYFMVFKPD
jgi:hypothetical protein